MKNTKLFPQVLTYILIFLTGIKLERMTNYGTITTHDWVSLGVNVFFVAFLLYRTHLDEQN